MTTFDDRERAFENRYAHDAELAFRAAARRNRLLGAWAADLLGLSGEEATAYEIEVLRADLAEAGDEDVYAKLATDLGDRADEATIRAKMAECSAKAKAETAPDA
ncbi:DUF1476 domain-containing protein [Mesobaculum littorinae]|uniref:DUF1476 domain-containing protein n=1 Tax=Mesobaculum littorinae TaxID=2486419 RepID=A0A438ALR8_9RHOB|nr:DUF1476 domain-containing protein [Mesobaculum littorinae]RVV99486.1 DUF1476 domain-containing protein [Mesobaculum littorinae]